MQYVDTRTNTYLILVIIAFLIEITGSITPFIKRSGLYFNIYYIVLACIWLKSFASQRLFAKLFIIVFFLPDSLLPPIFLGKPTSYLIIQKKPTIMTADLKHKILFLIPTLSGGGAEKVLLNLLRNIPPDLYCIELVSVFRDEFPSDLSHIHYRYMFKRVFRGNIHLFKFASPNWLFKHFIGDKMIMIL